MLLCLRPSVPWLEVSKRASFGPFNCEVRVNEEFRLGTRIISSSLADSYCEDSLPRFREELVALARLDTPKTVSVRALPLASTVKIAFLGGFGTRDSGMEVRLVGRGRLIGEDCPRESSWS
jgi:hypothetical protein